MKYEVILYPEDRSYPEECGFMLYEGSFHPKAESVFKAAKAWIKEQLLPLRVDWVEKGKLP